MIRAGFSDQIAVKIHMPQPTTKPSNSLRFRRWHRWPRGWRDDPRVDDLASQQVIAQVLAELRPMAEPQPPDPVDLALAVAMVHGLDPKLVAASRGWSHRRVRNHVASAKRALGIVRLSTCGWASGGFWSGLRLSGAIHRHHSGWRLGAGRPWLAAALADAPVKVSVGTTESNGRLRFSCPAGHLSPTDPIGVDVLAGVLAGGLRQEHDGGWWIVLPRTAEVLRLIDTWGLSCRTAVWRGGEGVRVSVFYGRLLQDHLPAVVYDSVWVGKAGDCPVLPVVYAGLLWDPSPPNYNWPHSAKVLPGCVCSQTRIRRGWGREFVMRAAERLGIAHVPLQLRALLEEYRDRALKALRPDQRPQWRV